MTAERKGAVNWKGNPTDLTGPEIKKGDKAFVESEFFDKMKWIADVNDDIYDPS